MKITKPHFKEIVRQFITVMDREKIDSLESLDDRLYDKFNIGQEGADFIEIDLRPSTLMTQAYKVSYAMPNTGTPLELSINPELEYSLLIIKVQEPIMGYTKFLSDKFGNIGQHKIIHSAEMSSIRKELEKLLSA